MNRTQMATQICGLEWERQPTQQQNQDTFRYKLVQVICFSQTLEST